MTSSFHNYHHVLIPLLDTSKDHYWFCSVWHCDC